MDWFYDNFVDVASGLVLSSGDFRMASDWSASADPSSFVAKLVCTIETLLAPAVGPVLSIIPTLAS